MTFSIVARSADGQQLGVAVASKFLAVGVAVPAAQAGVGAVATQSYANLAYRPQALAALAKGWTAAEAIAEITSADEEREQRQVGVVGSSGVGATFTGSRCNAWAGGLVGEGYAIQGNILTGPEVVGAMEVAWLASHSGLDKEAPLSRRLLAALVAGDQAGGDRRGRQSAALLVVTPGGGYGGGSDVLVDLRSDDHPAPCAEVGRLLDLHDLYFGKPDLATALPLAGELAAEVAQRLAHLGYPDLETWAGVENYEERMLDGLIDPLVLDQLRAASGTGPGGE